MSKFAVSDAVLDRIHQTIDQQIDWTGPAIAAIDVGAPLLLAADLRQIINIIHAYARLADNGAQSHIKNETKAAEFIGRKTAYEHVIQILTLRINGLDPQGLTNHKDKQ